MRIDLSQTASFLRENDNYLIISHVRPDGDTLGSCAALCSALRRLGKTACMFPNPEITEKYIPFVNEFIAEDDYRGETVISVDVAGETMFCKGFEGRVNLCIDHHPSNPDYADYLYLRAEKASCAEGVLDVIRALCEKPTPKEADLLYIGLSTDCGCFNYGNVEQDTFEAAAALVGYGCNHKPLNKLFFRTFSLARLKIEGAIYANLDSTRNNRINISYLPLETVRACGATDNDCDDIASVPGKVAGSVVSALIREIEEGKCKISVRTNELVDSRAICEPFGGGGHAMAAGCTVNMSPLKAMEALKEVIEKVWPAE